MLSDLCLSALCLGGEPQAGGVQQWPSLILKGSVCGLVVFARDGDFFF